MPNPLEPLVGHLDRDGDERILLVGGPPILPVEVTVLGGTVAIVDPSAPTPSVRLIVTDRAAATGAVGHIFGEPALDALWGDDDRTDFPVTPGTGLAALQRLALLDWLRWGAPRNADPELIDLERAVMLWDLLAALDDDGLREADRLGRGRTVQRLIAEIGLCNAEDRPAIDHLLRPLLAAVVDGFVREGAGNATQRHVLRNQQRHLRELTELADPTGFEWELLQLSESSRHVHVLDLAQAHVAAGMAGAADADLGAGEIGESIVRTGIVDPVEIPRMLHGVLSADPDAVRWTIPPSGPILVAVARQPDGPVDDLRTSFTARLVTEDGDVLGSAALRESDDGQTFVARIERPADLVDAAVLRVDVTADDRRRPVHGAAWASRQARHVAGWAFAEQRRHLLLSRLSGGRAPEVEIETGRAAERLWADAAARFSTSGERDLTDAADDRSMVIDATVEPTAGLGLTLAEVAVASG